MYRKSCATSEIPLTITHVCAQQHGSKQVVQSKVRTEFKTFDRGRVRCPEKKAARVRAGAGEGAHWVIWSGSYWWIMSGCGGEVQTHTHTHTHTQTDRQTDRQTHTCLYTCRFSTDTWHMHVLPNNHVNKSNLCVFRPFLLWSSCTRETASVCRLWRPSFTRQQFLKEESAETCGCSLLNAEAGAVLTEGR